MKSVLPSNLTHSDHRIYIKLRQHHKTQQLVHQQTPYIKNLMKSSRRKRTTKERGLPDDSTHSSGGKQHNSTLHLFVYHLHTENALRNCLEICVISPRVFHTQNCNRIHNLVCFSNNFLWFPRKTFIITSGRGFRENSDISCDVMGFVWGD